MNMFFRYLLFICVVSDSVAIDSTYDREKKRGTSAIQCTQSFATFKSLLVSRCPYKWTDDAFIKKACEAEWPGVMPEYLVPVSIAKTGHAYKNTFCGLCHRFHVDDMVYWSYAINCAVNTEPKFEKVVQNIARKICEISITEPMRKTCPIVTVKPHKVGMPMSSLVSFAEEDFSRSIELEGETVCFHKRSDVQFIDGKCVSGQCPVIYYTDGMTACKLKSRLDLLYLKAIICDRQRSMSKSKVVKHLSKLYNFYTMILRKRDVCVNGDRTLELTMYKSELTVGFSAILMRFFNMIIDENFQQIVVSHVIPDKTNKNCTSEEHVIDGVNASDTFRETFVAYSLANMPWTVTVVLGQPDVKTTPGGSDNSSITLVYTMEICTVDATSGCPKYPVPEMARDEPDAPAYVCGDELVRMQERLLAQRNVEFKRVMAAELDWSHRGEVEKGEKGASRGTKVIAEIWLLVFALGVGHAV